MNDVAEPPPPKERRRQEDRTADTRRRLIDATVNCLYEVGYSATTISRVAKEAGASRGVISYHFATKADLMVAVRDAVYSDEYDALEAARAVLGTRAYLAQIPRYALAGMRQKPAIAVNEILLAARGDPELLARLRASENAIDAGSIERLNAFFAEVGLEPPANLRIIVRVGVAALRGLAIAGLVQGDDAEIDECLAFLDDWMTSVAAGTDGDKPA